MKKIKLDFEKLEKEVEESHPIIEFKSVYDSVLHLELSLRFMKSEKGKQAISDMVGSDAYEADIKKQYQALVEKRAELEFIRSQFS